MGTWNKEEHLEWAQKNVARTYHQKDDDLQTVKYAQFGSKMMAQKEGCCFVVVFLIISIECSWFLRPSFSIQPELESSVFHNIVSHAFKFLDDTKPEKYLSAHL